MHRCIVAFVCLLLLIVPEVRSQDANLSESVHQEIEFNRDIRPILSENCYYCHGNDAKHRMADLRLDVREEAIDGGAILPGDADASLLIERIFAEDSDIRMPPPESNKVLNEQQKQILRRWIEQGAEYQAHWAFIPPTMPDLPVDLRQQQIDYFVRKTLERYHLSPSPQAPAHTLARRAYLDLIGLPPMPDELDRFLIAYEIDAKSAYHELIEELLASPHYGERWGRWWLDQARYADSNGYSIDAPREIWPYRDWVMNALNADMPFDQFTIEQLAGDLLPDAKQSQKIATGFHRNTQLNQEGGIDPEQFRIDSIFDRVATTGTVWLGLTIGCAQCHDHKFDPLEQTEFYQLFAFLNDQDEPSLKVYPSDMDVELLNDRLQKIEAELSDAIKSRSDALLAWEAGLNDMTKKSFDDGLKKVLAVPAEKRKPGQLEQVFQAAFPDDEEFKNRIKLRDELRMELNSVPTTLVLKERTTPRTTSVFINGDFTRPADVVNPGTPAVLHRFDPEIDSQQRPSRLDLAKWIVLESNPLTARVIVNRVWQQYFGRGIVETENDFGLQGSPPTHPELLDYLALRFIEGGWSLKALHRSIVRSETYQQSCYETEQMREKDPNNYYLARQQRLRLDAEVVRDVALRASGLLVTKLGGPSVFPPIPEGVMGQGQIKRDWKTSTGEDKYRRGLYTFVYRGSPPPALSVFDAPEGLSTCTRRIRSNTPLQSLTLMNDSSFFEFATQLEKIIRDEGLGVAFRRCTSRYPEPDELAVLERLDSLTAARVMLNLDETVTRE